MARLITLVSLLVAVVAAVHCAPGNPTTPRILPGPGVAGLALADDHHDHDAKSSTSSGSSDEVKERPSRGASAIPAHVDGHDDGSDEDDDDSDSSDDSHDSSHSSEKHSPAGLVGNKEGKHDHEVHDAENTRAVRATEQEKKESDSTAQSAHPASLLKKDETERKSIEKLHESKDAHISPSSDNLHHEINENHRGTRDTAKDDKDKVGQLGGPILLRGEPIALHVHHHESSDESHSDEKKDTKDETRVTRGIEKDAKDVSHETKVDDSASKLAKPAILISGKQQVGNRPERDTATAKNDSPAVPTPAEDDVKLTPPALGNPATYDKAHERIVSSVATSTDKDSKHA